MQRVVLKAKIHRATVTGADLNYEGSCGIDAQLLRLADIRVGEQLHVVNVTNGSRAVTYAIEAGPGEVTLNGAMAHIGARGDVVILMTFAHVEETELADFAARIVHVDAANQPTNIPVAG